MFHLMFLETVISLIHVWGVILWVEAWDNENLGFRTQSSVSSDVSFLYFLLV